MLVDAAGVTALQTFRDYILYLLCHKAPGAQLAEAWHGDIARHRLPLNFCTATLHMVRLIIAPSASD